MVGTFPVRHSGLTQGLIPEIRVNLWPISGTLERHTSSGCGWKLVIKTGKYVK